MPTSALDDRMREGIARVGRADILVGIPSFNNAGTIGHVASTVAEGLRRRFPNSRAVIVNSDGGSKDGTSDVVARSTGATPTIIGAYSGIPGKGSAFRAIFEIAAALRPSACAVVDSDLRSITPDWIARLAGPIADGKADYITPLYARHKYDGTITNSIAYPLTRALYGLRLRQPIGGDFGFSGELARAFLDQDVWETEVAKFGIDIYMTTTALVRRARIAQAFLGAKIHDPKDPGADLAPMFSQVVGTAFRMAAANRPLWSAVTSSKPTEIIGDIAPVEPEAVNASVAILEEKFAAGRTEFGARWSQILSSPLPERIEDEAWARIVYDFLIAAAREPERMAKDIRALVPLYFGRVAAFIDRAKDLDTAGSEALVERQAEAFEATKSHLLDRWPR
ncbi:MAG: glycosyltransferase [Candidatus Limnocylindrales bacterium]